MAPFHRDEALMGRRAQPCSVYLENFFGLCISVRHEAFTVLHCMKNKISSELQFSCDSIFNCLALALDLPIICDFGGVCAKTRDHS